MDITLVLLGKKCSFLFRYRSEEVDRTSCLRKATTVAETSTKL